MKTERDLSDIQGLVEDYAPDPSIFDDDDWRVCRIKQVISELEEPQRNIILLYAELGSVRELAKRMGVSKSYMSKQICNIRKRILEKI